MHKLFHDCAAWHRQSFDSETRKTAHLPWRTVARPPQGAVVANLAAAGCAKLARTSRNPELCVRQFHVVHPVRLGFACVACSPIRQAPSVCSQSSIVGPIPVCSHAIDMMVAGDHHVYLSRYPNSALWRRRINSTSSLRTFAQRSGSACLYPLSVELPRLPVMLL